LHFPLDVSKDDDELGAKSQRHLERYKNSVASLKKRQKILITSWRFKSSKLELSSNQMLQKKLPKKVAEIASVR
jgi:hypothetical protein